MKIPTTLKHKPVIVAENYEEIDALAKDDELLGERLRTLARILQGLGY